MSPTVFLSAQPCFHGLHIAHALDLRALIRRCVNFVFIVFSIAVRIRHAARSKTTSSLLPPATPRRDSQARRSRAKSVRVFEIEASRAADFAARVYRLCAPQPALRAASRHTSARIQGWSMTSSSGFTRPARYCSMACSASLSSRPAAMSSSICLSHFASRCF